MTETALSLNLTVYILAAMGLTLLGTLFALISFAGTVRTGGFSRLFYTLFTFIMALYALSLWFPTTGKALPVESSLWAITANVLFYLTIFLYCLQFHFALRSRSHSRTVIALVVLFIYFLGFMLIAQLSHGSGTVVSLIRKPDWDSITITVAGLFLLIRLIMGFCFHEAGSVGGTVSLLLFLTPPLLSIILTGSIRGFHVQTFTVYSLPLLAIWEFARLFTAPSEAKQKSAPLPVGELREQLSDSRSKEKNLNTLLTDREEELGLYISKAKKISRKLLPAVIHHDGLWEVTTFFNPTPKAGRKELFDFYYTYGRRISGVSLFETPDEPDGALYGSLLKKEWTESFNESTSLASLYRRIDSHLKDIFGEGDLRGSALKLENDKIEYTGYGNPALYYVNGKLNKCAPLIQDKTERVDEVKSYALPCSPGDSFLICNDMFLNKAAAVTGKTFAKEKLQETLESFKGKSADMVRELIEERNKFLGKRDEADILVIYLRRKN